MSTESDLIRQLTGIAAALSVSTDTLLAMADQDVASAGSRDADAAELTRNFRALADPKARDLLLRLSRRLVRRQFA